ncbi:NYN domain-containing protein [Pseudoduganella sp.]|uniref:NYN domain-containing protein n=1 Tax=Pseudoduganella sp. TaxID=1880898 RepID=UPI0035B03E3C
MASPNENASMALFCDFENVALGVRDANYEKFDIKPVLERLLLKGSIVVKKAYCDWDRYKGFKAPMHEANFELIEIPHVRLSGKNSADIRMVVDALDLCYTKSHVNTFVIISGDSDFSPLVSKLRENAKRVIGVGVKDSTSDLLVANCDEFIFYDDLVRESRRQRQASRDAREQQPKRSPEEEKRRREEMDKRRNQCIDIAYTTFDALAAERGEGKIWASVLKEAIKRRKPDFSESYYGFRTFGNLLEEMKARGLLEFGRDEKSGAYVYRSSQPVVLPVVEQDAAAAAAAVEGEGPEAVEAVQAEEAAPAEREGREAREAREGRDGRRSRGNRGGRGRRGESAPVASDAAEAAEAVAVEVPADAEVAAVAVVEEAAPVVEAPLEAPAEAPAKRTRAAAKKPAAKKAGSRSSKVAQAAADAAEAVQQAEAVLAAAAEAAVSAEAAVVETQAPKRAKKPGTHKPSARSKLPKKPKAEAA